MKQINITLVVLVMCLMAVTNVVAEQNLVKSIANGCKMEIEKYCDQVTPGKGRILACLYAYQDKLSGRCEYALYDAAAQLERFTADLSYIVNECVNDMNRLCSSVPAGEGRLLQCLEKNDAQVSGRCKQALKDVGLK
jgi:hypothetical protein